MLVGEARTHYWLPREVPLPIVQEKKIRLGTLRSEETTEIRTGLDAIFLFPFVGHCDAVTDLFQHLIKRPCLRRKHVERVVRFVRCDVEIQRAVSVDVSKGHCRRHVSTG